MLGTRNNARYLKTIKRGNWQLSYGAATGDTIGHYTPRPIMVKNVKTGVCTYPTYYYFDDYVAYTSPCDIPIFIKRLLHKLYFLHYCESLKNDTEGK